MDKIANFLLKHIGTDGLLHFMVSAVAAVVLKMVFPVWAAAVIVMAAGLAKELYDKISKKGSCELKDLVMDLAGCLVGIL